MKKFKEFIKKPKVFVVTAQPVHGKHSQPKKTFTVTAQPVHGKHTEKQIKEEKDLPLLNVWRDAKSNPSDLEEKLHEHYDHSKLDSDEKKHLHEYSKSSYRFSDYLKNKNKNNITNQAHEEKARVISRIHDKNSLPESIETYHGAGFDPREAGDSHLKFPTAISSSISRQIALGFATPVKNDYDEKSRHVITFHLPKGSGGHYLGKNSYHHIEKEFLMKPGMTFKKVKEPEEYKIGFGHSLYVHHYAPVEGK